MRLGILVKKTVNILSYLVLGVVVLDCFQILNILSKSAPIYFYRINLKYWVLFVVIGILAVLYWQYLLINQKIARVKIYRWISFLTLLLIFSCTYFFGLRIVYNRTLSFWFVLLVPLSLLWVYLRIIVKHTSKYVISRLSVLVLYQIMIFTVFALSARVLTTLFIYWPIDFSAFLGKFAVYQMIIVLLIFPILVYFFGRGFYCSWICHYGARSEIFGDYFRELAPKSRLSVMLEFIPYVILLFIVVYTIGGALNKSIWIFHEFQLIYALLVMGIINSIIGHSLYPLIGGRFVCRYTCPMAAYLKLLSRFTRFRIKVDPKKCDGCGECTSYCQMGIDVMSYVKQGRDVKTSRCVGCGICVEKCSRGALCIEN